MHPELASAIARAREQDLQRATGPHSSSNSRRLSDALLSAGMEYAYQKPRLIPVLGSRGARRAPQPNPQGQYLHVDPSDKLRMPARGRTWPQAGQRSDTRWDGYRG